jgi:hypothetical protein
MAPAYPPLSDAVRGLCARYNLEPGPSLRPVLAAIASSAAPVGAVDIAWTISGWGRKIAMTSVYRALRRLLDAGVVVDIGGREGRLYALNEVRWIAFETAGHSQRAMLSDPRLAARIVMEAQRLGVPAASRITITFSDEAGIAIPLGRQSG